MGLKAQEPMLVDIEELPSYLRAQHSVYMDLGDTSYYLTDVNDHFWRVQSTEQLNDKGHYTDLTEPVSTLDEFLAMPAIDGKSILDLASEATFYASVKPE